MHTVHHTEAIILKTLSSGEANKRIWLFTREFGLVIALAQGLRKPGAKLKNQITDYSVIAADLVKGKDVWRLISASTIHSPLLGNANSPYARPYVRTLSAIERFMVGEGEYHALFDHVLEFTTLVSTADQTLDPITLDTVSLWRILVLFGYIPIEAGEEYLSTISLREVVPTINKAKRVRLIAKVQKAITESHL